MLFGSRIFLFSSSSRLTLISRLCYCWDILEMGVYIFNLGLAKGRWRFLIPTSFPPPSSLFRLYHTLSQSPPTPSLLGSTHNTVPSFECTLQMGTYYSSPPGWSERFKAVNVINVRENYASCIRQDGFQQWKVKWKRVHAFHRVVPRVVQCVMWMAVTK